MVVLAAEVITVGVLERRGGVLTLPPTSSVLCPPTLGRKERHSWQNEDDSYLDGARFQY